MAASGFTPIVIYHSTTANAAPIAGNLAVGELAINVTDQKIYTKNGSGAIVQLNSSLSSAVTGILKATAGNISAATPGTDYAAVSTAQTFTAAQRGAIVTDNDLSFNLAASNNFKCTVAATGTLTFTNLVAGQSGYILLNNSGGFAISAGATTSVGDNLLATISSAGVYLVSYFCDGTEAYCTASGALT
jgi:hypothetical protein